MLIPYRVKNPAKKFPYITAVLIALNAIIYALTSDYLISIREDVLYNYGFAMGRTPFYTFITAAFLHAEPFHLIGNMLFLWIFGGPVEDRLGPLKYLFVYFAAGLFGDLLWTALSSVAGHIAYGIGASGCIAGIMGAYLYLFPWSTVCVFYWFYIFWRGVWEVAAIWVIGGYFVLDVAEGFLSRSMGVSGGVANFCHVGGVIAGAALCLLLRMKRDSGELSEAKAIHANMKDLSIMPLYAIQAMVADDPTNTELLRSMVKPAYDLGKEHVFHEAVAAAGTNLIDKDPVFVAYYLTTLRGDIRIYQSLHLLRLAGTLERRNELQQALQVYTLLVNTFPETQDAEAAFYKMAYCFWNSYKDASNARNCLQQMLVRFPNGSMASYGRALLKQIGQP